VVYDHFASKRQLYVSLLELYAGELFAFMGKRLLAEGSAEERFEAGFDAVLEFVETHPVAWRMLFRDPPPSEPEIVEAKDRLEQQATAATVTLIASGSVADHPDDPAGFELVMEREMAAEVIKATTTGLASWWYGHRDVPREHLVYVMMNALWVGFERFTAGKRWRR
jgi:AcrR family transcriptional regulator